MGTPTTGGLPDYDIYEVYMSGVLNVPVDYATIRANAERVAAAGGSSTGVAGARWMLAYRLGQLDREHPRDRLTIEMEVEQMNATRRALGCDPQAAYVYLKRHPITDNAREQALWLASAVSALAPVGADHRLASVLSAWVDFLGVISGGGADRLKDALRRAVADGVADDGLPDGGGV